MAFIPAKCTQCGANITVDNTKEAGICEFCGTAFVTEKAVNNYTINNTNHITAQTVNVYNENKEKDFQIKAHKLVAYTGKSEVVVIPHHITEIGNEAFEGNTYIKEVIMPPSVREIGEYAFSKCINLEKIEFSTGLQDIEGWAFYGCKSLVEVELPDSVWGMANSVFEDCSNLKRVKLSENLVSLMGNVFLNCTSLEEINLPPNIGRIGGTDFGVYCFKNCTSLKEITIPASVYSIGDGIFNGTNLDKLIFENADNIIDMGRGHGIFKGASKLPEIVESESFKKRYKKVLSDISPEEGINCNVNSGGCYIATCVYGSYDCPQVWTLRRFRDYSLDTTLAGKVFIKCYYAISPTLVKLFGNQRWFKAVWKSWLDLMVKKLNDSGVADTKYQDKY